MKIPIWSKADWATIKESIAARDWRNELKELTAEEARDAYKQTVADMVDRYVSAWNWWKGPLPDRCLAKPADTMCCTEWQQIWSN